MSVKFNTCNLQKVYEGLKKSNVDAPYASLVFAQALALKEAAVDAFDEGIEEAKHDPEFDPGDSVVYVNGRRFNVLDIGLILAAIGVQ